MAKLTNYPDGFRSFTVQIGYRERYAAARLICAAANGCEPFSEPLPRWRVDSHIPSKLGIYGDPHRGTHGRALAGNQTRSILKASAVKGVRHD